jgi:glycerophosphoryl diester phosphodiesterase
LSAAVCAHRGASLRLADNSLAAFEEACAVGSDAIETDVRRAEDGRLVLAHDAAPSYPDDVVGLADLVALAAGRTGLLVELKETGIEADTVAMLADFPGPLKIISFLPQALAAVRRLDPEVELGLLVEPPLEGDPLAVAAAGGCGAILVEHPLLDDPALAGAAECDLALWVWTVNGREELAALFGRPEVAGVITDDPALAIALRDRRRR